MRFRRDFPGLKETLGAAEERRRNVGEVELGITALSTLIATSGVDVVGPIPDEIQNYVVFTGGISATTRSPPSAQDFLRFLTSAAVDPAIRARGLQPVR